MGDPEEDMLDELILDLVGRSIVDAGTEGRDNWTDLLEAMDEVMTRRICGVVESLDGDPLRALTAQLLHRACRAQRLDLLRSTFPNVATSAN